MFAAAAAHDAGPVPEVLLGLAFILVGAKLAGSLAEWLGQPAVLGELLVGVVLGNLTVVGGPDLSTLGSGDVFIALAELGAVLLLFEVGLESTPRDMMAVGLPAFLVAVVGVVTPMALGFGVGEVMRPQDSWMVHAFLGAMLAATSVGITARVLSDLSLLKTRAARIILGAAVIDDVLGLVVLAVVSGIIQAAATGATLGAGQVALIIVKAVAFLVGALVIGGLLSPQLFARSRVLPPGGIVLALSLSFCFILSYLALRAGLAPIVGAFAAGLVLDHTHFQEHVRRGEKPLHETLAPLIALFVPVFFVRMGMLVDVRAFADAEVLRFALVLSLAAIAGKLVCGLVVPRGVPRLLVGLGMLPRGEVGLIFAGIGAKLFLDGAPVIGPGVYAAAVFMVVVTTLTTPPALVWAARRGSASAP
jgi:Kef-type K+ transport system membrane component KefB